MGLEEWAPDWLHPSHYGKTRSKEDRKAQGQLALMDLLSQRAQEDPRLTGAALGYDSGPIQARYNDRPLSEMDMSERVAMLDAIKADPKLLDLITADAGAIPYLGEEHKRYFANEAQDYTRNLVAKQLGLDYAFIPTQYRFSDHYGYSSGAPSTSGDRRLLDLGEYAEGTPTGRWNPNSDWASVVDALQTRQARGTDMSGLPSVEEAQRMLAQQSGLLALINDPGYEEQQARAQSLASLGN
jgi:hypothetical protein